jgi:NitT/TauT family transport system permease protein
MELIREHAANVDQDSIPDRDAHIFVGLKITITCAVIGAVIGEFVGSEDGLSYLILVSSSQSRTPLAFACWSC